MSGRTLIVDTNLLVLFIVGKASPTYIKYHKRLQAYTDEDFFFLENILSSAARIIVTPNTLTETLNMAKQIKEPARTQICEVFRTFVKMTETEEKYEESERTVDHNEFLRLGLADSVLLAAAAEAHTLLTVDLDLYLAATSRGYNVINFNHERLA